MQQPKKILLVDIDDARRETRVRILAAGGYDVAVRADHEISDALDHEGQFDLLILAKEKAHSAILLLLDIGVFVPRGTLSQSISTGLPDEMMTQIAEMLSGSKHIREIKIDDTANSGRDSETGR